MATNVIFWNICPLNNWKFIVLDQYYYMVFSGILDDIDKVYITFMDEDVSKLDFLLSKSDKFIIHRVEPDLKQFERTCLHSLLDWSKDNEANVLYIHTKGVSKPDNKNIQHWRRMMEYFLIERYKECLPLLEEYDVLGLDLVEQGTNDYIANETHKKHFSGNFWWSKTSHIKKLPRIRDDIKDLSQNNLYWLTERWILQNNPDALELYADKGWYYDNPPNSDKYIHIKVPTTESLGTERET